MLQGNDACIISLGLMAQRSKEAAIVLKEKHNISVTVIDLRCLVPLDLQLIKREVKKSGVIFTVEENPRLCGWGAEISSITQTAPVSFANCWIPSMNSEVGSCPL